MNKKFKWHDIKNKEPKKDGFYIVCADEGILPRVAYFCLGDWYEHIPCCVAEDIGKCLFHEVFGEEMTEDHLSKLELIAINELDSKYTGTPIILSDANIFEKRADIRWWMKLPKSKYERQFYL